MITYEPFYETLKSKKITTYALIKKYGVRNSLLNRLRHNRPINTTTIDYLCKILNCQVEDILKFIDD